MNTLALVAIASSLQLSPAAPASIDSTDVDSTSIDGIITSVYELNLGRDRREAGLGNSAHLVLGRRDHDALGME